MSQQVHEVLVYHHSHLDVGYTQHPLTVWARQEDYLRRALVLADRYASRGPGEQFKWTVESTAVVERFLRDAAETEVDQFVRLSHGGLIETTGMYCNTTPLFTPAELVASFRPLKRLRDQLGIPISSAINHDVNGQSWLLPDLLQDLGIDLLLMGINQDSARPPAPRPRAFWWEGYGGHQILTWNGEHYGWGQYVGIPYPEAWHRSAIDLERSHQILTEYLDGIVERGYPYDFALVSVTNTVTWDNDGPNEALLQFIHLWNAHFTDVKMKMITPRELPPYLARQSAEAIRHVRGEWTDWWAHGVGSSARETALARWASRVWQGAAVSRMLLGDVDDADHREFARREANVVENLMLYDEHTWGSAQSISQPDTIDSLGQWSSKAAHAYDAAAESWRLWTLASRGWAERHETQDPAVMVFNPLPWPLKQRVILPHWRAGEDFGSAWPLQELARDCELANPISPAPIIGDPVDYGLVDIPAFGFRLLQLGRVPASDASSVTVDRWSLNNAWFQLTVDSQRGAIRSLKTVSDSEEWCIPDSEWMLGEYVYQRFETPRGRSDLQPPVPAADVRQHLASTTARVRRVAGIHESRGPGLCALRVDLEAEGVRSLSVTYTLYEQEPWIDLTYEIDKSPQMMLESLYIAFPADLPGAQLHYESGGAVVQAEKDQLPNACRDYYSVQNWADLSNCARGMAVAMPDTPLIMWGGLTVGAFAEHHEGAQPVLLSWVMNNLWHTNFKASQEGPLVIHYRIYPHCGAFAPAVMKKFGAESTVPLLTMPLMSRDAGTLCESSLPATRKKDRESFCTMTPATATILSVEPAPQRSAEELEHWYVCLQLADAVDSGRLWWNASFVPCAAWECNLQRCRLSALPIDADGAVLWSGPAHGLIMMEVTGHMT